MRILRRQYRDLAEIVGDVFDRNSRKRKFYTNGNGCYIYTGCKDQDGYPQVSYKGKTWRAARFVYTMLHGRLPDYLVVRHTCDNAACIHPLHLIAGTQQANIADKVERGRQVRRERHYRAKLTEPDIAEIRRLYAQGTTQVELAKTYGMHQTQISNIVRLKSWR